MKKLSCCIFLLVCMVACGRESGSIEINEPIVVGSVELGKHVLVLQMYDGYYDFEHYMGPNQGSNWIGEYELAVIDTTNGEVVSEYDLSEWKEPMRFNESFLLNVVDYNEDGNCELLIGQRISDNQSSYHMYYITSQLQIGCYSDIGEIIMSSLDISPTMEMLEDCLVYSTYNNSDGNWVQHTIKLEMLEH